MASGTPEWKDAFANQLFTTDSPADDFIFDSGFQTDQMASGSGDYNPGFSDSLFQQFTNFSDSPGQLGDGGERHDSTATQYRRDTVVPVHAANLLPLSTDTSTHHSPASSASPAHVKRETPESDANRRNLMSPAYQAGLPVGSSPLDFGPSGVDGLEDFDAKGMFPMKREMGEFDAMATSGSFWDSPSTITASQPTIGNPLHSISSSSFDALTSTPQASTFQVTSSRPTPIT